METHEEWKPVTGYEGLYEISSIGNVRTFHNKNGVKFLKKAKKRNGYVQVVLVDREKHKYYALVHILVCSAFVSPRPRGMYVNHKDGVKDNNSYTNLEWVTGSENMNHAFNVLKVGVKPVIQIDITGRVVRRFFSIKNASDSTGFCKVAIGQCCRGLTKTCGGYKWRFDSGEGK